MQATAIGCLYFLDPTDIADASGLQATGIILMLLNAAYVLAMLVMIAVYGADKTKRFTRTACAFLKSSSHRFRHSSFGISRSSSFAAFKLQSMSFKDFVSQGRHYSGGGSSDVSSSGSINGHARPAAVIHN